MRARKLRPRSSPVKPDEPRLALVKSPSLERRIALDLLSVLESEVPDVDPVVVGLTIADESRRREENETRAWGDEGRAS